MEGIDVLMDAWGLLARHPSDVLLGTTEVCRNACAISFVLSVVAVGGRIVLGASTAHVCLGS